MIYVYNIGIPFADRCVWVILTTLVGNKETILLNKTVKPIADVKANEHLLNYFKTRITDALPTRQTRRQYYQTLCVYKRKLWPSSSAWAYRYYSISQIKLT